MSDAKKQRFNRENETPGYRFLMGINSVLLVILCVLMIVPFWYLVVNSMRPEEAILQNGYLFWFDSFSLDNYRILLRSTSPVFRGYLITISSTVVGTSLAVAMTTAFGYVVSKREVPLTRAMLLFVFIGWNLPSGLIAWYLQMRNLGMGNSWWANVPPDLVNLMNVLLMKTFFQEGNTRSLEESAKLDGANDLQVLWHVVLPVSKPIIATIALFYGVAFWNTWWPASMLISDQSLYPIQLVVHQITRSAEMLFKLGGLRTSSVEGLKMASASVAILPILLVYPFVQKYFVKGVMIGAFKE